MNILGSAAALRSRAVMPRRNRFVYLIRSDLDGRTYVGVTNDVQQRLATHNSGGSVYTAAHRPWHLVVALEFADEDQAARFGEYLKSSSGRGFARRHFRLTHSGSE